MGIVLLTFAYENAPIALTIVVIIAMLVFCGGGTIAASTIFKRKYNTFMLVRKEEIINEMDKFNNTEMMKSLDLNIAITKYGALLYMCKVGFLDPLRPKEKKIPKAEPNVNLKEETIEKNENKKDPENRNNKDSSRRKKQQTGLRVEEVPNMNFGPKSLNESIDWGRINSKLDESDIHFNKTNYKDTDDSMNQNYQVDQYEKKRERMGLMLSGVQDDVPLRAFNDPKRHVQKKDTNNNTRSGIRGNNNNTKSGLGKTKKQTASELFREIDQYQRDKVEAGLTDKP